MTTNEIRLFEKQQVRTVWDKENEKWWSQRKLD